MEVQTFENGDIAKSKHPTGDTITDVESHDSLESSQSPLSTSPSRTPSGSMRVSWAQAPGLIRSLATVRMANPPHTRSPTGVVAIDGRSGAGKTTLAAALARELVKDDVAVHVIEVESFIGGWNGLIEGLTAVAEQILAPVRTRGFAHARTWDWHSGTWATDVRIPPTGIADVLILTGCGSTSTACAPFVDVAVWVEADEARRRERVTGRDGDPSSWWKLWAEQEERLPRGATPDVVVEN